MSEGQILRQNIGHQAAVINTIVQAHRDHEGSLVALRSDGSAWRALVSQVDATVRLMPLWKLQRVGNEVIEFLYDNAGWGRSITLKPGVADCLRAYYGLLRDLIQRAWLRYVRQVNGADLGDVTDLGSFLFGQERSSLDQYRPILRDVQQGRCFYCHRDLNPRADKWKHTRFT
jgi:hypothetical protein